MRGPVSKWFRIAGWLAATALAGCDTDSIAPPPPGKSRPSSISPGAMPARAKEIALILPADGNTDLLIYDQAARTEAGFLATKIVFRTLKPAAGDPPAKQGELIRQAVAEGASALVVVPDATKETADALAALDPKKVPVVLLGRTPTGEAPASATVVAFEPFAASARKLVDSAVADSKKIGAAAGAPVIFATLAVADENSAGRDAALADALKAAKVPIAATVPVPAEPTEAQKVVEAAMAAHPTAFGVIADDEAGVQAAIGARQAMGSRKYLIAGYFAGRNNLVTLMTGPVSALAERSAENLVRRAVRTALERAQGKEVGAKVLVPLELRVGGNVAAPPPPSAPSPQPAPSVAPVPDVKKPAPPAEVKKPG